MDKSEVAVRINNMTDKKLGMLDKKTEQIKERMESIIERRTEMSEFKPKVPMLPRVDIMTLPYRPKLTIPKEKSDELFSLINNMDTQQLKQYSVINAITLNVEDANSGDNLIHKVILSTNLLKKEFHRLNVIKFLVQNGVNPDKPNRENHTPLHLACREQYYTIVDYLVDLPVELNYVDNYGMSPFHYALQGKIELLKENNESESFIAKPKKVDLEKNDKLNEIRKNLWELIKDNSFLKLLTNTVKETIISDISTKKKFSEFLNKISTNSTSLTLTDRNKFLKESVDIFKNEIETFIKNKWDNFKPITELEIHEKDSQTSYDISDQFSPLKVNNVKKLLKDNSKDCIADIKQICDTIKYEEFNVNEKMDNKIHDFYKRFYEGNRRFFIGVGPNLLRLNGNILDQDINSKWEDFNKSEMDPLSIDYADNIINWEQLIFIGGARKIMIRDSDQNIKNILTYDTIEKKVFHILCDDILLPLGIGAGQIYKIINNPFDPNNLNQALDTNGNLILDYTNGNLGDKLNYDKIKLAFYILFNKQDKIIELVENIPLADINRKNFLEKWIRLFNEKNKASVLYAMYSNTACLIRNLNLEGILINVLPALVSVFNFNEKITNETLSIGLKKFFISSIYSILGQTINNLLIAHCNVLLADNLNDDFNYYLTNQNLNSSLEGKITNLIGETDRNRKVILLKEITNEITTLTKNKVLDTDLLGFLTFLSNGFDITDQNFFKLDKMDTLQNMFGFSFFGQTIENFENNNNYEGQIINNLIYMMGKKQITSLFPYINHIFEMLDDPNPPNPNEDFSLLKLQEARHLGLNYLGLIPSINNYPRQLINNNPEINIQLYGGNDYTLTNKELNNNLIPLPGNFIYYQNLPQVLPGAKQYNKFRYFIYSEEQARPPLKFAKEILYERNRNFLIKILKTLLCNSLYKNNLISLLESSSNLTKSFTLIYPAMTIVAELLEAFGYKVNSNIDRIIQKLNKWNSNILIYYFIFNPGKLMKIPKFNYYQLPSLEEKGRFLFFNSGNNLEDEITGIDDSTPLTVINPSEEIMISNQGISDFKRLMRKLSNGFAKGDYIIRNEDLILSKEKNLPPSITSALPDLYKYNFLSLILDLFNKIRSNQPEITNLITKVKELLSDKIILDANVLVYFTIGKLIQEIINDFTKNYVRNETSGLLNEIIGLDPILNSSKDELIIKSIEYEVALNKSTIDLDSDSNILFIPRIEKEIINDYNDFIIYPEEYSNSDLLKSKYKIKINYKIYEKLLDNDINPFLLDGNNQSAIFPIIKLHCDKVMENLKRRIDFRDFSDINIFEFLKEEFNNHTSKLIGTSDNFKDWLSNFVSYQKEEVKTLIYSNERYKSNIPNNLEDSFNIICYIMNQYISESIYKMEDIEALDKLKLKLEINNIDLSNNDYGKYLFVNEIITTTTSFSNIYQNEKANYNCDKFILLNKEIKKLEEKKTKLVKGLTKNKIEELITSKNVLKEILKFQRLKETLINKTDLDTNDIIERYKSLDFNDINKGILSRVLAKLINVDNLNASLDLITFKIINLEKTIINQKEINNLDLLENINNFYKQTNNISEIYMTSGKYIINNHILEFIKKLLIFMTQQFIIVEYIKSLEVLLYEHIKNTSLLSTNEDILRNINFYFEHEITFEGKNRNLRDILFDEVSIKIIENTTGIFMDSAKENEFSLQSVKEILDNFSNLFTIFDTMPIAEDAYFFKNVKELNLFYDTFTNRTILNWNVICENVLKFNINQGRIIKCIYNLFSPVRED